MSFRSKRNENGTFIRSKRETASDHFDINRIPELCINSDESDRNKRDEKENNVVVSEFKQIMRDINQDTFEVNFRKKRNAHNPDDIDDNEDGSDNIDTIDNNNNSPDAIPILFFSTQPPQDVTRLEVNENGELILRDVTKRNEGWYACAALNEAGSTVKRVFIRVISNDDNLNENIPLDDSIGSRFANEQNIIINSILPMSPNSLDVSWEINDGIPSTSLTLHYRVLGTIEFQTTTAMIDSKEFRIDKLRAHTEYEIFASVPHGLSGSISNIRKGKTLDGPPSLPPTDVRVGVINNTAAYVRWSPPPLNMLNGELTGYKVILLQFLFLSLVIYSCFPYFQ